MDNWELFLFANTKKKNSSSAEEMLKALIDRSVTNIDIPEGTPAIGSQVFNQCRNLTSVTIPNSVTNIGSYAFTNCNSLANLTIPTGVTRILTNVFYGCSSLTSIEIPNGVVSIGTNAFTNCSSLISLTIPASVTSIEGNSFADCSSLSNVTLGNGFNANGLNLSASTLYSIDTIVAVLDALADRTSQVAYTLIFGSTNLAKLSNEQIAIATEKNWTLA